LSNSKGQLFSTDLIVGLSIFLFVLAITLAYSNNVALRTEALDKTSEMRFVSAGAINSLVLSEGYPADWQNLADLTEVKSIGLANGRNIIDGNKLASLVDYNQNSYSELKSILGLTKYDVYIAVEDVNSGNTLYEFGLSPENEEVVSSRRLGLLNNEEVFVRLEVFE